jgi:hypothetical protein
VEAAGGDAGEGPDTAPASEADRGQAAEAEHRPAAPRDEGGDKGTPSGSLPFPDREDQ